MVLAYLGLAFAEAHLAQVLGMQAAGTPASVLPGFKGMA
jgi:hypothetical protein